MRCSAARLLHVVAEDQELWLFRRLANQMAAARTSTVIFMMELSVLRLLLYAMKFIETRKQHMQL